ncbi:MvaI/BcnI family restriction endonuclease [Pelagimonas varians]|uniref:MvaI/BcnI family restriction endonuclease n=1 Tax=Pelagimonas varians TaxID=696760 RepID=UPI001B8645EE|nr:MvaI/BcnI family restriction endonuclease [Pelagimonas varians]
MTVLTSQSIDATLIQPTKTGLGKSILDATAPIRNYLRRHGLHDYELQGTGARDNGVELESLLVGKATESTSRTSLYRPKAKGKGGDPRIWFSGLPNFVQPDDLVAIVAYGRQLICFNITRDDLGSILQERLEGPALSWMQTLSGDARSTSDELLGQLRQLAAKGPLMSVMPDRADTAIGRTLETALGIQMNSRKDPDYKGIELKAFRKASGQSRQNRKTLFAKVANWQESKFKSSREILDAFGYQREEDFKLYCTVSAKTINSQGLSFELDDRLGKLNERSDQKQIGVFATWFLEDLRKALAEKHNETFWVSATAEMVDGREHFELQSVLHTQKPILSQFEILLSQGEITMDHLIKRNQRGRVAEKGPLFKIDSVSLPLLFPPSISHDLRPVMAA